MFSKDGKYRYLVRKIWNKDLPKAAIVLLYPGYANELICDTTTMLCVNQAVALGFGGLDILNIFSLVGVMSVSGDTAGLTDKTNDNCILESAKTADKIIVATGRGNNKAVIARTGEVIKLLEAHTEKLFCIADKNGNAGFHPLSPRGAVRVDVERYQRVTKRTGDREISIWAAKAVA